ncbi:uncharacterized protein LOC116340114 [Contarinia nasturtii]|uniref:uncharacterized protein LOC116340114 n=1 Tax=Contarinia nasturtii TaxID=265458 RepID=UPI0012D38EAE|nr:uncharacterized protein LOC116340114 [Contarinia nasturtii]
MHFWIDKRSQACGFGRARAGFVAASLSGSGYDFYHPPRRNKSMLTPVHRFPNTECRNVNRPNVHRPNVHRSNIHHQEHHQHHTSRAHHEIQTHAEVNTSYGEPADFPVLHQYQSHLPIELGQGTLRMNAIQPSNEILADERANVVDAVNSTDSQVLPSHLKCGMWASLALATVFLAAFQGSGLEILIFCAFSATFFVAACTVSLCRRPRNLSISPPQLSAVTTNVNDIEIAHLDQHEPHVPNVIDPIAPPPPYHIAILNDNPKIDDSPPSYDKLII